MQRMMATLYTSTGMITVTGTQLDPSYVFGPVSSAVLDALKIRVCSSGTWLVNALKQIENRSVWPFRARVWLTPKSPGFKEV